MKQLICAVVVVAGAVLGSGCSSSGSNSASDSGGGGQFGSADLISSSPGSGGATVWKVKWFMGTANENGDQGQKVTVHVGDSVIWVSTDASSHTVSPSLSMANQAGPFVANANTTFSTQSPAIAFPTAGTWGYICNIHGPTSMSGTITVQ